MLRSGVLPPASSGEFIASRAKDVSIKTEGINKLAGEIIKSMKYGKLSIPDPGGEASRPDRHHKRAVDWIFVTDALNFCFWTVGDNTSKWKVEGETGYNALEAALSRAIREGYDITDPHYYSKITENDLDRLMRSDDGITQIPLLTERVKILHEVGNKLIEKYNGTFENCIKAAECSVTKLLRIIVNDFLSFRDEGKFEKEAVSFYKRAQILVADLWNCFEGKDWGKFDDIDKLTMFADYRVPQVLVYFGVLNYSNELYQRLADDEILKHGSREEIEIRGCSIHAVELLRRRIKEMLDSTQDAPNSALIDYYLWCYRRKYEDKVRHIPFHKVISVYY